MVAPPPLERSGPAPTTGDRPELRQAKYRLRVAMRAARAALGPELRRERSRQAARHFLAAIADLPPGPVAAFWPLGDEIDTLPLIAGLQERGRDVLLPRQVGKGQPLDFHRWQAGDPLADGPFGVREPLPEAPRLLPRALTVPLLAFDRAGHRLGYGAGFYDRTLVELMRLAQHPLAIGYAFDLQEVERVPTGAHDVPLPMIVTETRRLVPGHLDSPGPAP